MGIQGPQGFFIYHISSTMNALTTYLQHVRQEFTHIVWPTRQKAIAHTLVVMVIAATIALLVSLLDYLFSGLVSSVIGV